MCKWHNRLLTGTPPCPTGFLEGEVPTFRTNHPPTHTQLAQAQILKGSRHYSLSHFITTKFQCGSIKLKELKTKGKDHLIRLISHIPLIYVQTFPSPGLPSLPWKPWVLGEGCREKMASGSISLVGWWVRWPGRCSCWIQLVLRRIISKDCWNNLIE